MTDARTLTPSDAQLAAEYALGLLDGDERHQAAKRAESDPLFGIEVARWRGRLAPMLSDIAPAEPPKSVWDAIGQRTAGPAANDNVAELRHRLRVWRTVSGGATAIAASLALILMFRPPSGEPVAPQPQVQLAPMVASLASDKGDPMLMATWDPATERLIVAAARDMPTPPGHSHQIWVIPADGKPMAVAVMPGARMHMQLSDLIAEEMRRGATIAISVEPAGGSPTGLPTGPVVASGTLQNS